MQAPFMITGVTDTAVIGTSSGGGAFTTPQNGEVVRVVNDSIDKAFFRTGVGAQTALVTDTPLAPSSVEVFRIPSGHTHWAAIRAAGSGNVYLTRGQGF